jgi:hypothetical protein
MAKGAPLTIPTAVENAYILLLGQVTLIISRAFMYLLPAYLSKNQNLKVDDIFTAIMLISVSLMMAVNILSGWMSCRDVLSRFSEYSNGLLTIDILFLLVFFMMNNIISVDASNILKSSISVGVSVTENSSPHLEAAIHAYAPFMIYVLSIIVCLLYLWWNIKFMRLANESGQEKDAESQLNISSHNRFLCFATLIQLFLALISLVLPTEGSVRMICLAVWVIVWGWLNFAWFLTTPTTTTQPNS